MLETGKSVDGGAQASPERVFARRVKRERLRRGWRQEDLAEALSGMGLDLHPSAIAKLEREPDLGKRIEPRMIRLNEAHVLASAFRLRIDQMLSDDDLSSPAVEVERLRRQLDEADQEARAAEESAVVSRHRAYEIRASLAEAERRQAERATATLPDLPFLRGLGMSEAARDEAERFIANWFQIDRERLEREGWGTGPNGEAQSPDAILGLLDVFRNVFPDLASSCDELAAKLNPHIEWWRGVGHQKYVRQIRQSAPEDASAGQ